MSQSRKPSSGGQKARRIATWAATVLLLGYVFHTVPFSRTWEALADAGPAAVIGVTLVYFLYCFAADTIATWATFRWFCARLDLRDVFAIRGATYLLAIINYNVGQGGIVYVVGKRRGVGLARATGTVLLTMGVSLVALLVLASIGSFLGGGTDERLRIMQLVSAGGLAAFLIYLVIIAVRPGFLARRKVLEPLFDAGIVGHGKAWLVRFPHVVGHVVFQWILLRLFHVDISLTAAATLLPVIFVIAWIPITIQGLGTMQVAAMELLGPYAVAATTELQNARVVAFSLTQTTLFVLYSIITGLLFLRHVGRLAPQQKPAPTATESEEPSPTDQAERSR